MTPAPLTPEDRERAHRSIVGPHLIERLDVHSGTAGVVKWMKPLLQTWAFTHHTPDGPYPEWAFRGSRVPSGFDITIVRGEEVVRAGRLVWNELANRSTGAALDLHRAQHRAAQGPAPGEQTRLAL